MFLPIAHLKPSSQVYSSLVCALIFCIPCPSPAQRGDRPGHEMKPPPAEWKIPPAPIVEAEDALDTLDIVDGFRIELVASEPDIHDPVALAFDANGRIWVAQMISFMPDVEGKGQGKPLGKISILEDSTGDGKVDKASVFLDGIVLPRALALTDADKGLLYADDSKLYHIEIKEGYQAGKQTVIDPGYARGGNVEHKANGLLFGMDNWYYSAKTDKKYRRINGKWVSATTEKRGQWGISQDNYGRLCTNTNSNFISMELYPPGVTIRNPNHKFTTPTSVRLKNQSTWPSRLTPGINRGYLKGFLTKDGYLAGPTATCGPVIYRGDNFPQEFQGNLFLPEPAGNLVKRALVTEDEGQLTISQAYQDHEFFTSTDERSRIVNAYTAPDGTLFLVDFYRGILQDGAFMTTYLRNEILRRNLDKGLGRGRIFRIVRKDKKPTPLPRMMEMSSQDLVSHLNSANGWQRDTAQRLIVQRQDLSVVPALREVLHPNNDSGGFAKIHALSSLMGLDSLKTKDIQHALSANDSKVKAHAIRCAETFAGEEGQDEILKLTAPYTSHDDPEIQAQLCASLGLFHVSPDHRKEAFRQLIGLLNHAPQNKKALRDLSLSGLHDAEAYFLQALIASRSDHPVSSDLIAAIIKSGNSKDIDELFLTLGSDKLTDSTRQRLIEQLSNALLTQKKINLLKKLLAQAKEFDMKDRQALANGLLDGRKSIKGRYRPLNMGTTQPDLLNKPDLLPEDLRTKLIPLFDYTGGQGVDYLKSDADKKQYELGKTHYQRICLACHQLDGKGSPFLAPPLVDSEWVNESPERLIALVMDGMTGPVTVNGITYTADTAPQVQPLMPGVRINPELNDEQIAAILTYVRNSWGNGGTPVSTKSVADYRKNNQARAPFTQEELLKIK